jgi:5-formyltetrahydrofolate cyclo-ligase
MDDEPGQVKRELRRRLLGSRRARSASARAAAGAALDRVARSVVTSAGARVVAAYASFGTEPPTVPLLDHLVADGVQVLVPHVCADLDLDWAAYAEAASLRPGPFGAPEPVGPLLGVEAITTADLVLVPALAVAPGGARLGRGAGSYDRTLARVPASVPVMALVYDDELLDALPHEPHDRLVDAAITPSGVIQLR